VRWVFGGAGCCALDSVIIRTAAPPSLSLVPSPSAPAFCRRLVCLAAAYLVGGHEELAHARARVLERKVRQLLLANALLRVGPLEGELLSRKHLRDAIYGICSFTH